MRVLARCAGQSDGKAMNDRRIFARSPVTVNHLVTALLVLLSLNAILPAVANPEDCSEPVPKEHYLLSDSVNLHYIEGGSGQPIVLLHGNDGTVQDFTMSIFDQLADKYRTFAFDRPGHGDSKMLAGASLATPERQAQILHGALVRLGVLRPILVAHSWSGSLALSYAVQYPNDLAGVVLLGGMSYGTKGSKFIYRLALVPVVGSALGLVFKATGRRWVRKQLEEAFIPDRAPCNYVERFLSSTFKLSQLKAAARDEVTINPALRRISQSYATINVPVVIVTGDHDMTVSPQEHSYRLHKVISRSQLIVVRNGGHELCFSRPKEVMQAIETAVLLWKSWSNSSLSTATVNSETTQQLSFGEVGTTDMEFQPVRVSPEQL